MTNKAKIPKASEWHRWHFRTDEKTAQRIIDAAESKQVSLSGFIRMAILKALKETNL